MTSSDISHDEEAKAALARAFDDAWQRFIDLEGDEAATDDNRRRLAARIVALAKAGEDDEAALAEAGLIYLRVLAEAVRLGARSKDEAAVAALAPDQAGHAFTPEIVAAMSAALDLCLDELPFHIPSNAVQVLSASILKDASRGEYDTERMRVHAMEALKAR